jgi:hypothetical protein
MSFILPRKKRAYNKMTTLPSSGSNSTAYDYIFSLGYRCSSAGILKSLGIKTESYPFDWMVSRLPIIEHCLQTGFQYLTDPTCYKTTIGATHHYPINDPASRQWICDESICYNELYEFNSYSCPSVKLYLPSPITPANDAYGYKCMMNHRNITQNSADKDYFDRCVQRWNNMTSSATTSKTLSLYIHPATFQTEFNTVREDLIADIRRFHIALSASLNKPHHNGIYIIPVRTPYCDPTQHCAKYVLEEQPDDEMNIPGVCKICILWTNSGFIDAGEIFMGNCHVETYVVKEYLMRWTVPRIDF